MTECHRCGTGAPFRFNHNDRLVISTPHGSHAELELYRLELKIQMREEVYFAKPCLGGCCQERQKSHDR